MQGNRKDASFSAAVANAAGAGDSDVQISRRLTFTRLKRHKRMMVTVAAAIFAGGMAYSLLRSPDYESTARLLVSQNQQAALFNWSSVPMPPDLQSLLGGSGSAETEAAILSDDQLLQSAYERLTPAERMTAFGGVAKLPDWAVKAKPERGTDVVEVRVTSHTPKGSADLGRAIVAEYFERDFDADSKATRKARHYAYAKMNLLEKQMADANKQLAAYKQQSRLIAPDTQMDKFAEYMTNLQTTLDTESAEQVAGRRELAALELQIAQERPDVISGNVIRQNPRFATGTQTVDQLYSKRAEMMQEFQPQSPEMQSLDAQIKQEEARLRRTAETIVDSEMHSRNPIRDALLTSYTSAVAKQAATDASVSVLRRRLAAQTRFADSLPEKQRRFLELQGQVDLLSKAYGLVSQQYYSLVFSEQQNTPRAQILSNAVVDQDPVSLSLPASAVLFALLGVFIALTAGLVTDRLDDRVQESEDAEQAVGYFALAVAPLARDVSPLIARAGAPGMLESFRVLRGNVYRAGAEEQMKTLAIASPSRGEGKTVTCANLAAVLAMDGKTVAVVDCNMEHPCVRELVGHTYDYGLTHVLMGSCELEQAIVQGSQENLFLVPSGPLVLNFPELLNSERGQKALAQLGERFDYVLIDCPPTSSLADMQSICSLADGVLMVARIGSTTTSELISASAALSHTAAPIIGLVVNGDPDHIPGRLSRTNRTSAGRSVDSENEAPLARP